MYAIIETGGKQYQVKEGDEIFVEKLDVEGEFTIDKVIMVGKDDGAVVGAPYVEGASSPYVNVIAVKSGNEKSAKIQALIKAVKSEKVAKYISEKYPNGEVVKVF